MSKHGIFLRLLPCLTPVLFIACTAVPPSAPVPDASPEKLFFVSQPFPVLDIPGEAGARSNNPGEDGSLRAVFREAYAAALLRGLPLTGVLGGDRVNPWPASSPLGWSQNWAGGDDAPNSWSLPGLVLALGSYKSPVEAPAIVFTVSGPVLDLYGKSAGYNRANGAAGYGVPLGEQFFLDGAAVQRFSRGRMIVSREGGRFSFEEDTLGSLLDDLAEEEREREFGGPNIPSRVREAFAYAWAFSFSEEEGKSDGPAAAIGFPKPWILQSGKQETALKGFYYKSYNGGTEVFVVLDAENLPLRAYRLSGPILRTILARKRLPGLDWEKSLGNPGGSGLGKTLAAGFALYGPPLSDTLPLPTEQAGGARQADGARQVDGARQAGGARQVGGEPLPEGTLFLEAQRFSRGWIVVVPVIKEENTKEDAVGEDETGDEAWEKSGDS